MSGFTKMIHYPLKWIGFQNEKEFFLVLKYLHKDVYYK